MASTRLLHRRAHGGRTCRVLKDTLCPATVEGSVLSLNRTLTVTGMRYNRKCPLGPSSSPQHNLSRRPNPDAYSASAGTRSSTVCEVAFGLLGLHSLAAPGTKARDSESFGHTCINWCGGRTRPDWLTAGHTPEPGIGLPPGGSSFFRTATFSIRRRTRSNARS